MKPLSLPSWIAIGALALTMAAPPAGAKPPKKKNPPPVMKEEAIATALARFDALSEGMKTSYPDNEEYQKIVRDARATFKERADGFLPAQPYRHKEFDVMSRVVEVTITGLEQEVALREEKISTGMSDADFKQRSDGIRQGTRTAMVMAVVAGGLAPAAPVKNAEVKPLQEAGVSGSISGTVSEDPDSSLDANGFAQVGASIGSRVAGAMQDGLLHGARRGPWNGGWYEGDEKGQAEWEQRVGDNSPIVILGVKATKCAMDAAACVVDAPIPTPVPPLPTVPGETPNPPFPPDNGGGSGTGGAGSSGPTNVGAIDDIVRTISTKGGSNAMAGAGVSALQRGDFARAVSAARNTLAFDPGNRTALEVLYAAKGRVAAGGALDAGAASLGRPSGGGIEGGFGPAPASPGIAALAQSGAARLAQDQAVTGAQNALKLRDGAGAVAILSKALAQDPDNALLLHYRALAYGRQGRWEDALKDTAAGLRVAPGNAALLGVQALAQNRTRRWRDALATSEALIAADPRSAWGYAARAHARGGLGDRDGMLADINRAAAIDPNFRRSAAEAAELQLPMDSDTLFLFPGEPGKTAAPAAAGRGRRFSVVVIAALAGGLLFALGLLSVVLKPVKDSVVSVFTKSRRAEAATGPVATAQPASAAGHVAGLIRGQYEISRQIGQGGMGTVYEGTDRSLGRRVAIKKMRDELRMNPRERDRFIIEAKTVASLRHPAIVDIYAIAEEGDDVYLVFEYVDGKTVHDLVQTKGRLDPAETLRVTRAMGEALTYAHSRGVIHRDMKPSNVMLTGAGQIKVMDFGIARMAKDALTRYSMTNTVVGTPPYMAPEQEQGVVRKESDVYSLAICAYEMLTGKLPFIGMGAGMLMNKINMSYIPPSRAIAGLPEPLDEVFLKAFQADPDRRFRTPQEFVTALAAAADGARRPV